jgi:hypothetical protein
MADLRTDLTAEGDVGKSSRSRSERPKRRAFSPEYKPAMVEAYDAATEPGAKGALLRGLRGVGERANALFTITFKALRPVSLAPDASERSPRPRSSCSTTSTTGPCRHHTT